MSWKTFKEQAPEMAEYGRSRFGSQVAYLATTGIGGKPRVFPVTPILALRRLFVFIEPSSPKGRDLQRNGYYALHSSVSDMDGTSGEFYITGQALTSDDPELWQAAAEAASYDPPERYILFELLVVSAMTTDYDEAWQPVRQYWNLE
jgi:hypothetical protein